MPVTPALNPTYATPLAAELAGRLRGHGPLPLAGYMTRCLYDPHLGYYTCGYNFQQTEGVDFTTAPALSPLFGATLANWVARTWQHMGQPQAFCLTEAGPGGGQLMHALLSQLKHAHPACHAAAQVHLIEVSPALTATQQHLLPGQGIQWHTSLTTLPRHQPIVLIGNEVLDAFPVDVYTFQHTQWQRRCVMLDEQGHLTLLDRPTRTAPPLPPGWQPVDGAVLEVSVSRHQWLSHVAQLLSASGGTSLFIDYGYAHLPPKGGETLQALHRHQPVSVLHRPGETDLTAHVHFGWAQAILGGTSQLTDLAPFLMRHGLLDLAEPTIADPATQGTLQRLLHPARMGGLFKVLQTDFPANA